MIKNFRGAARRLGITEIELIARLQAGCVDCGVKLADPAQLEIDGRTGDICCRRCRRARVDRRGAETIRQRDLAKAAELVRAAKGDVLIGPEWDHLLDLPL